MVTIYGIKNCDTMKKAFRWLESNEIHYEFHDYKKEGVPLALAKKWVSAIPIEQLVNKRGTTWRKLDQKTRDELSAESALILIQENPSLIKRPLLEVEGEYHLGFNSDRYHEIFV